MSFERLQARMRCKGVCPSNSNDAAKTYRLAVWIDVHWDGAQRIGGAGITVVVPKPSHGPVSPPEFDPDVRHLEIVE